MLDAESIKSNSGFFCVKLIRSRKFGAKSLLQVREHLEPPERRSEVNGPLGAFRTFGVVGDLRNEKENIVVAGSFESSQ